MMEFVRALTWSCNDSEREHEQVFGYAIVTDTELLLFALSSKHTPRVSRSTRKQDLPNAQVEKLLSLFDKGKAKKTHRFQRSDLRSIGYINAAAKLRVQTADQTVDLGDFPFPSDLAYITTEIAKAVFPEVEPHREQVEASLSVQETYLKAIGTVAVACIGLLVLAIVGGADDFDSTARGSGFARLLGDIPLPLLLIVFAAALAYPIFLMVRQARRGYVMRVWGNDY